MLPSRLDRYLLSLSIGTLGAVIGILMSLMVLENIPRLVEVTRLSGQRGYILGQTILGLLPEYAGIGMVVGLYLAVAMAIRKLTVRGELSVIEATGISPLRWMRMPLVLSALGALFVLANQGWLLPSGEKRFDSIYQKMERGEFGYRLAAGEFTDLGAGFSLYFDSVDRHKGTLAGLIFVDGARVYNAASGTLSLSREGEGKVTLINGQTLMPDGGVLNFSELSFYVLGDGTTPRPEAEEKGYHRLPLDELLFAADPAARAAAYARLLWVALALAAPALAYALARPPLRSSSPIGLVTGLALLVAFLKSITLVETASGSDPAVLALAVLALWAAVVALLLYWQYRAGTGALDQAAMRLGKRTTALAKRLLPLRDKSGLQSAQTAA